MKIKDLKDKYPKLYNRALDYQYYQHKRADANVSLTNAFTWTRTNVTEGGDFWFNIFQGYFDKAKIMLSPFGRHLPRFLGGVL